jgi:hypothetical protein
LYLDIILDLLFNTIDDKTASALSRHAAGQCAEDLSRIVGEGVFVGRLDDYQRDSFTKAIQERQAMPKGPEMGSFSPFGPPEVV